MITARPKGMNFREYKIQQKTENKNLNYYLKHGGEVVYLSWRSFTNSMLKTTNVQKYPPAKLVMKNGQKTYKPIN